jgi:integrase
MSESLVLLPADSEIRRLLLNGVSNRNTRSVYEWAFDRFTAWYAREDHGRLSPLQIMRAYRASLEASDAAPSSINVELSALRRLLRNASGAGYVDPKAAGEAAAVENTRVLGRKAGNWLTGPQARKLLLSPDETTLKGKRDRALLGVLVGCGLRREEAIGLEVECIEIRESRWTIPELVGKGKRTRLVPVPAWVKDRLDEWTGAAEIGKGKIFRAVRKDGVVAAGALSSKAVWNIVMFYAGKSGLGKLSPHDLRRTCAKICEGRGGKLRQIQLLLGHSSIATTERYLGDQQEIARAINDRMFREGTL